MEKKRTLYSLESDIRKILEDNDFVSTGDEGGKQWYMNLITDLAIFVQQELEKAREEGYKKGYIDGQIEKINKPKTVVSEFGKTSYLN